MNAQSVLLNARERYARMYGESYPGEAWDGACDAHQHAVETRLSELSTKYANDPVSMAAEPCDFDNDTLMRFAKHIMALRALIPTEAAKDAILQFDCDLEKDRTLQSWAEDEITREWAQ